MTDPTSAALDFTMARFLALVEERDALKRAAQVPGAQQAAISQWLDSSTFYQSLAADPVMAVRLARLMFRVHKIAEEYGEVQEAILGAVGENPRKGVTNGWDKVEKELLDVAGAALGALEHMRGNDGSSYASLLEALDGVYRRAGLDEVTA